MFIQTKNLIKTYDNINVVNGVNIKVEKGEVVGLLGPNGAGKTTTFYMIVGLEKPNCGMINISGEDVTGCQFIKERNLALRIYRKKLRFFVNYRWKIIY